MTGMCRISAPAGQESGSFQQIPPRNPPAIFAVGFAGLGLDCSRFQVEIELTELQPHCLLNAPEIVANLLHRLTNLTKTMLLKWTI